jgi:hypothetical protein
MRIVELIWKDNRYPGLHAVIEDQVAGRIDRMLHGEWLSFIDRGMKLGRLSASFLQQIVKQKDDFCSLHHRVVHAPRCGQQ